MKKTLLILLLFICQYSFAQNFMIKDSLVNYFNQHQEELDPIEGIWMLNVETTLFLKDSISNFNIENNKSEWAIIKDTPLRYKVISVDPNHREPDFYAYFENTAVKGLYTYECYFKNPDWKAKATVKLSDNVYLDYGYYTSKKYIEANYDYQPIEDHNIYWDFNWIKKIPYQNKLDPTSHIEWGEGSATGFFIDKKGFIATNYHAIVDAENITISFIKDSKLYIYTAEIVVVDQENDLAILKVIYPESLPFINIPYAFNPNTQEVGTKVFSMGYPKFDDINESLKFTDGRITDVNGYKGEESTYQNSAPLQYGYSGGPLFDFNGNIVGINKSFLTPDFADSVSYSIKSNYLIELIKTTPEISINLENNLEETSLNEKIKILSEYVVLIKHD